MFHKSSYNFVVGFAVLGHPGYFCPDYHKKMMSDDSPKYG